MVIPRKATWATIIGWILSAMGGVAAGPGMALAGGGAIKVAEPATNRVVSVSASGRFMIAGPGAAINMGVSRWAEQSTDQFERFTGIRCPFRRGRIVEIRLGMGLEGSRLVCGDEGEGFRRVLLLDAWPPADADRADELLCRALAAGYLEDRRRGASGGGVLPEWFTMGIARNLRMETRLGNRGVVAAWRPGDGVPAVAEMLRWQSLPGGWSGPRGACGMLMAWIGTFGETGSPYARVLDRLADTGRVTAEWLAVELAGGATVADMERAWQHWLRRQANLIQTFGELSSALILQLESELPLQVTREGVSSVLGPREAMRRRGERAVSFAALDKAQRLRVLTLGKAEELTAVGEAFARYYESLSEGAPALALRVQIYGAERALARLSDLTRKREAYLDAVERDLGRQELVRPDFSGVQAPVLEKGAIERYLDGAEQRFRDKPEQPTAGNTSPWQR